MTTRRFRCEKPLWMLYVAIVKRMAGAGRGSPEILPVRRAAMRHRLRAVAARARRRTAPPHGSVGRTAAARLTAQAVPGPRCKVRRLRTDYAFGFRVHASISQESAMLQGKTALVTGSTSGIGLGIARAFAAAGANVVLNGLGDEHEIEKIRSELAEKHGVTIRYDGSDLAHQHAIEAMMARAIGDFGAIDVLVNNAGIQFVAPIDEFPVDRWHAIIALNLTASFHTIRLAMPAMKKKGWGRIVNIASAHALVASPYKSAYVAAKHAVAGLTKTVALEVAAQGITVNAVCPGYVWTPLVERQIPDTAKARGITEQQVVNDVLLAAQPTKKFVHVDEVAALCLFLAGSAAASITGTILPVDGGWTSQ